MPEKSLNEMPRPIREQHEKAVLAFLNALSVFGIGVSWGGFESLAIPLFDVEPYRTATKFAMNRDAGDKLTQEPLSGGHAPGELVL